MSVPFREARWLLLARIGQNRRRVNDRGGNVPIQRASIARA